MARSTVELGGKPRRSGLRPTQFGDGNEWMENVKDLNSNAMIFKMTVTDENGAREALHSVQEKQVADCKKRDRGHSSTAGTHFQTVRYTCGLRTLTMTALSCSCWRLNFLSGQGAPGASCEQGWIQAQPSEELSFFFLDNVSQQYLQFPFIFIIPRLKNFKARNHNLGHNLRGEAYY